MKSIAIVGLAENDKELVEILNQQEQYAGTIKYIFTNSFQSTDFAGASILDYKLNQIDQVAEKIDECIICESLQCSDSYIEEIIARFLKHGVNVYNFHVLNQVVCDKMIQMSAEYNACYQYMKSTYQKIKVEDRLKEIDIPVIYVAGVMPNTNKFATEYRLQNALSTKEYNVGVISSNEYVQLFGGVSFPKDIFLNNESEMEKVVAYNQFVAEYIQKSECDILIIGLPGYVFNLYENFHEQWGMLFEMKKACAPDYIILNVLLDTLKYNSLDQINKMVVQEVGIDIDAVMVTNIISDVANYELARPERILRVKKELCDKPSEKGEILVVYSGNENGIKDIAENFLTKFEDGETLNIL